MSRLIGLSSGSGGRTNAKLCVFLGETTNLQNPSMISSFANRNGGPTGAMASACTSQGRTQPEFFIENRGTVVLSFNLLTKDVHVP